jgi:hypothetical protein
VAEAATVISAIIEAGLRFPSNRLPELFCGFTRDRRFNSRPMSYIKSCSPQAWAAASPFLFLQILLDVQPQDDGRILRINPAPNDLFYRYTVENVRTGAGRASFSVRASKEGTSIHLLGGEVGLSSDCAVVE